MLVNHSVEKLDHTSPEVAETIWQLFQLAYRVEADLLGVSSFPPLKRSRESIGNSDAEFLGVWEGKVVIAAIEISRLEDTMLIDSLVVNPEYFRQGLAKALFKQVLKNKPGEEIRVYTADKNLHALSLYKKLGFVESGNLGSTDSIDRIELKRSV
jgi:ribosomal protein S18 acetylase RimI-like enzyme